MAGMREKDFLTNLLHPNRAAVRSALDAVGDPCLVLYVLQFFCAMDVEWLSSL